MSETKEKCPVCKAECENGATACSVCGFTYEPKIDMTWPIPEDTKNWIETVVKPYRAQWEAKKLETGLLAQIEAVPEKERKTKVEVFFNVIIGIFCSLMCGLMYYITFKMFFNGQVNFESIFYGIIAIVGSILACCDIDDFNKVSFKCVYFSIGWGIVSIGCVSIFHGDNVGICVGIVLIINLIIGIPIARKLSNH